MPDLLASGKEDMSLADIEGVLPFQLDRFQAQAIDILLQGSSVVVSAPTGAGKTVIAEAATLAVLARYWDFHRTADDAVQLFGTYCMRMLCAQDAEGHVRVRGLQSSVLTYPLEQSPG